MRPSRWGTSSRCPAEYLATCLHVNLAFALILTIRYVNKGQHTVLSPISIANLSRALPAYYKRVTTTVPGVGPRMACTRYQCKVTHEKRYVHHAYALVCHELHGIEC
jgi:hypothetical protein